MKTILHKGTESSMYVDLVWLFALPNPTAKLTIDWVRSY